jgi:uncharacterized protein YqhQ
MKKEEEQKQAMFRVLVLIISGIIFYFWTFAVFVMMLINIIFALFSGKNNKPITEFSEIWLNEIIRLCRYLLFLSNEKPFPFAEIRL